MNTGGVIRRLNEERQRLNSRRHARTIEMGQRHWRVFPVAKHNFKGSGSSELCLEAPSGFEPLHRSFADCSLSHLGTAPLGRPHYSLGMAQEAREKEPA